MKKNSGITLSMLMLSIVILAILAASVVYTGTTSIAYMKKNKFVTEMQLIQKQVDIINEEIESGISYENVGININGLSNDIRTEINNIYTKFSVDAEEQADYVYFDTYELEKIGLIEITQNVIINFETKTVYSVNGIEIKGVIYNNLYEIQALEK